MRRYFPISLTLLAVFGLMLCAVPACALDDIVTTATHDGHFTTLLKALQTTGLADTLQAKGQVTLFAPTDAAFAKMPPQMLNALLADTARLKNILLYHVAQGKLMPDELKAMRALTTLQGGSLKLSSSGNSVRVNNARIVTPNVMASNGIILGIDTVLQPRASVAEVIMTDTRFTTLCKVMQAANLTGLLNDSGPITVFAPTDEAFAKLPAGTLDALLQDPAKLASLLEYHIVAGKLSAAKVSGMATLASFPGLPIMVTKTGFNTVQINNAQLVVTDIQVDNGIVHVIDTVLMPPDEEAAGASATTAPPTANTTTPAAAAGTTAPAN